MAPVEARELCTHLNKVKEVHNVPPGAVKTLYTFDDAVIGVYCDAVDSCGRTIITMKDEALLPVEAVLRKNKFDVDGKIVKIDKPIQFKGSQILELSCPTSTEVVKLRHFSEDKSRTVQIELDLLPTLNKRELASLRGTG